MNRFLLLTASTLCLFIFVVAEKAHAKPLLKGPLPGVVDFDPDTGFAAFLGGGNLTLMGKVAAYGEFLFDVGEEPGTLEGVGVMAIVAASGDVLVAQVTWLIDAEGNGELKFRWPDEITFSDGTTVISTGRFVELKFPGIIGKSSGGSDGVVDVRLPGNTWDTSSDG